MATFSTINAFCTDKTFMLLATSYGLTVGSSYAVSTLLAQIIVPVFKMHDEVGNNNNKFMCPKLLIFFLKKTPNFNFFVFK